MFGKAGYTPRVLLILFALSLLFTACSEDDSTGPEDDGPLILALEANDWPMDDGNNWTYIRRLKTVDIIFSYIQYADYNLQMAADFDWAGETPLDFLYSPYIHIKLDGAVDTGEGIAQIMRGTRSSELEGGGEIINEIEMWVDADPDRIRYMGENADAADDSLFWDRDSFDWIRFGEKRWEILLEDFSGEETGMVSFGQALGFGVDIDLDMDSPPNDPLRSWPDSLISYSLVHEMVGVTDVAYSEIFQYDEITYFPAMADTVFEGCKWMVQGIEYEVHLTNQRNPNAGPGESGIPLVYLPERTRRVSIFQPMRLLLLAPDLGPIRIVTYREADWILMPEEMTSTELEFIPDFMEIDYLMDSNLLH
jgi:hypothetical protein